ncbi:MAG: hypothetical protein IIY12_00080, partial [Clostridia bacterium]|nr:hypothetical protein [Clostridia bacterium]
ASEVRKIYEQTFGSGTFEDFKYQDYFSNYSEHFRYESATDCYAYLRWSGGGGVDSASAYASFVKAEKIQDGVELYIRYGSYQSASVSSDGVFKMYRDSQMRVSGSATPYYTSLTWSEEDLLREGKIDDYLPLYKHTFRDNGAGGYYWVSTEMVQPENAERIGEFFEQQKNPVSTSTNQSSHTTDYSSETISESKPESPAMFSVAVWVCVGIAILSLFSIVVPIISKKE